MLRGGTPKFSQRGIIRIQVWRKSTFAVLKLGKNDDPLVKKGPIMTWCLILKKEEKKQKLKNKKMLALVYQNYDPLLTLNIFHTFFCFYCWPCAIFSFHHCSIVFLILFSIYFSKKLVNFLILCDALRDLVPFVQFKKRGKRQWRSATFWKIPGSNRYRISCNPKFCRETWIVLCLRFLNPFVPNAPFVYLLKTSENRKVSWYFQGVGKGSIRNE